MKPPKTQHNPSDNNHNLTSNDDNLVRLSKLMSEQGFCSRREADEFIANGLVMVDGQVISELGHKVRRDVKIELTDQAIKKQDKLVTILLNKPIGYVSNLPEKGYEPAITLLTLENFYLAAKQEKPRNHPRSLKNMAVTGRLDIDSVGLLVFTQDGRIAKQLIGEDSAVEKEYLVRVQGELSDENLRLLNHGLWLDGLKLKPAKVSWQNEDQLKFVLNEGRKRQIRRMCELVNLRVVGLKRVRIGKVMLGHLPEGQWRYLSPEESF